MNKGFSVPGAAECGDFFSRACAPWADHLTSPAAQSCRRRERRLAVGLGIFVFSIYLWTLCPGVFPGVSAVSCAGVLRLLPGTVVVGHPLWLCAARLAAAVPLGELPFRLNLFSALCGAGAVALLFRLTTGVLFELLYEDAWQNQQKPAVAVVCPKNLHLADEALLEQVNGLHHRRAMAGGVVAALAFAFCAPFWSASVSLHAQTFDMLLLLAAGCVLLRYAVTGSAACLFAVAFLWGMGLVEAAACVVLLPVILGMLIVVGKRHEQAPGAFIAVSAIGISIGFLVAVSAAVLWAAHGGPGISVAGLSQIAAALARSHIDALSSGLPRYGWLLLLLQGVVPPLAVCWGMGRVISRRDGLAKMSRCLINTAFIGLAALTLFNLPGSPWHMAREGFGLPVMTLLGMSVACGGLFVNMLLLGWDPDSGEIEDEDTVNPVPRLVGFAMSSLIALIVAVAPFLNLAEADGRRGAFAGDFCRELLAAAPQARCFVTDGLFDASLLVEARVRHRPLALVKDDALPAPFRGGVQSPHPVPTALGVVSGWLRKNAGSAGQVAFLTSPGLWTQAGFQPVPDLLSYRGEKQQDKIDVPALLERHRDFWQRIEARLVTGPGDSPYPALRSVRGDMRRHASRLANDLGVLCLYKSALHEADEAFRHAQLLDGNNLCAFLNQYALSLGHPEIGGADKFRKRMDAFAARPLLFKTIPGSEIRYGCLYRPFAEMVVQHELAGRGARTADGPASPLMEQLSASCRAFVQAEAVPPRRVEQAGGKGKPDEELASAVRAVAGGQWRSAETQLRRLTRDRRNLLSAWSLLAEVLMNKGEFDEVQNEILPAMRQSEGSKCPELIDMTEGCLALRRKPADYAAAHACFSRVLQLNPDIEEAQNQLLQAGLALGDKVLIEKGCADLLAHTPGQPLANAVLGSLRLSQGRLEEAEKALKTSITGRPSAATFNDLADTLRRAKRLKDAEAAVHRAILLSPDCYQAWDTLGNILLEDGRLEEADGSMRQALSHGPNDPRPYLTLARLRIMQGRLNDAKQSLAYSKPLLSQASAVERDEHADLTRQLDAPPAPL